MAVSDKSFGSYPPSYVAVDQKETLGIDSDVTTMSIDENKEGSEVMVGFPHPDDENSTKASAILADGADDNTKAAEGNEKNFPEPINESGGFPLDQLEASKSHTSRGSAKVTVSDASLESFPPYDPGADQREPCRGNHRGGGYSFDQQKPAGSTRGGDVFDSGCNLSGVRKVWVRRGRFYTGWFSSRNAIQDLLLEFHENSDGNSGSNTTDFETPFDIDRDDSIVRIDVWTEVAFVAAIRFHLASGRKSKIYGELPDPSPPPSIFRGIRTDSRLVGVHGTRGKGFLQRLGFTFAYPNSPPLVEYKGNQWDRNHESSSTETPDYYFSSSLSSLEFDTVAVMKEEGWSDWFITNIGRFLAGFVIPAVSYLIFKRIKNK